MKRNASNKKTKFQFSLGMLISAFITAYFSSALIKMLTNYNKDVVFANLEFLQDGLEGGSVFSHLFLIVCITGILIILEYFYPKAKITPHAMLVSTVLMSVLLLLNLKESNMFVYIGVMAVMAIVILYTTKQECFHFIKSDAKPYILWICVGAFTLIFGYFIAGIGVLRQLTYSTPNFDFGIFCNMYHNMAETGLPNVTCERDQLLSHFAVHFSPVFYIFLPIYAISPSAITLQILQTLTLYSGIIPLVLIAKKKGLSNISTIVLSAIYAAFPALGAGTFYDLHENCFLVPLLLWMFYFYESKKYIPMAIFGILTLTVKEDAFIYILIFALYVLFSEKNWKLTLIMAAVAVIYFATVYSLMQKYGTGILSDRYNNLIYDKQDGIFGAVKTIILNPAYVISQLFITSKENADKIWYVLQLFLPLGFMPFATKKIPRYVLVAPILLNIITTYQYLPNISFQYSFGVMAFLFYATVLNASELQGFTKKYLLTLSVVASVFLFLVICIPKYDTYDKRLETSAETYEKYNYALTEVLPEDASVAASSFLITHIYDRDEIYEVKYHKENGKYKTDVDFVVLDMRYKDESNDAAAFYLDNGYEEYYLEKGCVWILKKST